MRYFGQVIAWYFALYFGLQLLTLALSVLEASGEADMLKAIALAGINAAMLLLTITLIRFEQLLNRRPPKEFKSKVSISKERLKKRTLGVR